MINKLWSKRFSHYLKVATDIIPKLPNSSDPTWMKAIKIIGVADSFNKIGAVEKNKLSSFFDQLDVKSVTNQQIVDMFFSTNLGAKFQTETILLDTYTSVIIAHHNKIGTLYFVDYSGGTKPRPSATFHVSSKFNFIELSNLLWALYEGRIYIEMVSVPDHWMLHTLYSAIPKLTMPLFGAANNRLEQLVSKHFQYKKDKLQRTYLFVGTPGSGKSTMATRMADRCGTRILQIDSTALANIGQHEMDFLIENLKPDFIIFDDLDKVDLAKCLPTVLLILSNMKVHTDVGVIITVNDPTKLNDAILRPERIDEVEIFDQSDIDNELILKGYLEHFGVNLAEDNIALLLKESKSYSAVWMRELALRAKYESVDAAVHSMNRLKNLANPGSVNTAKAEAAKAIVVPK
jgi:adenylate kinase family enzyme